MDGPFKAQGREHASYYFSLGRGPDLKLKSANMYFNITYTKGDPSHYGRYEWALYIARPGACLSAFFTWEVPRPYILQGQCVI